MLEGNSSYSDHATAGQKIFAAVLARLCCFCSPLSSGCLEGTSEEKGLGRQASALDYWRVAYACSGNIF